MTPDAGTALLTHFLRLEQAFLRSPIAIAESILIRFGFVYVLKKKLKDFFAFFFHKGEKTVMIDTFMCK